MRTFAMILDNPGEQPHQTRYRDPATLAEVGYSDLVIYPTTGLCGLLGTQTLQDKDQQQWVQQQYQQVEKTIQRADEVGMATWLMCDAPSLDRELVGSAMSCVKQPEVLCPASDELMAMLGQTVTAMLTHFDQAAGIVLRLGDTDAMKLSYLMGNDLYQPYCSRCSRLGRADRLIRFIRFYYDLVVETLGKTLIVRGWNVRPGGMHDDPTLCQRVVAQLPKDDRLIWSFKFTQTDFWRYQKWNPSSLVCGDRPVIYELECQREFEAKGAVPNYQPALWSQGMDELPDAMGLADVTDDVAVVGLWAWVRGGGWRGPYLSDAGETWIDANVCAVPILAQTPDVAVDDLARQWIVDRLGCDDHEATEVLTELLTESASLVRQTFYVGAYARDRTTPWYPAASFIQDDQIDAEAAWAMVQRLRDRDLDEVILEKQTAQVAIARLDKKIKTIVPTLPGHLARLLTASCAYTQSLTETLTTLLMGMVAYRRYRLGRDRTNARTALKQMTACQQAWLRHQRIVSAETASPFESDNLMTFTQRVIDEMDQS